MPSDVYNRVIIRSTKEDIDSILEALCTKPKTMFDFNTLIPMPEEVYDTLTVNVDNVDMHYSRSQWLKTRDGYEAPFGNFPNQAWLVKNQLNEFCLRRLRNLYGWPERYIWSKKNWGTRWNAYDVEYLVSPVVNSNRQQLCYTFKTAWAEPAPIIIALRGFLDEWYRTAQLEWQFRDSDENFDGIVTNTHQGE
jgi:hypothetical protein